MRFSCFVSFSETFSGVVKVIQNVLGIFFPDIRGISFFVGCNISEGLFQQAQRSCCYIYFAYICDEFIKSEDEALNSLFFSLNK